MTTATPAAQSDELKARLAEQQRQQKTTEVATADEPKDIVSLLRSEKMKTAIRDALPNVPGMDLDRFIRLAITAIRNSPKLGICDMWSLAGALMTCALLGLEPGTPLGHVYLVPFKNRRQNDKGVWIQVWEATLIVGYTGYIDLAHRSGSVQSIYGVAVHQNDYFLYEEGINRQLIHRPRLDGPRGEITFTYAVAKLTDGAEPIFVVLDREDIDGYRKMSKTPDRGPWVDHFKAMAIKTAVRRLRPWLPMAVQDAELLAVADSHDDRTINPLNLQNLEMVMNPNVRAQLEEEQRQLAEDAAREDDEDGGERDADGNQIVEGKVVAPEAEKAGEATPAAQPAAAKAEPAKAEPKAQAAAPAATPAAQKASPAAPPTSTAPPPTDADNPLFGGTPGSRQGHGR